MDALTIQEAAETTDWSPRMLRYIERAGLIEPQRSGAGYRLYGPAELQRLRTLRELVTAIDAGFEAQPRRPEHVPAAEWLRWEQDKHSKLLALAGAHPATRLTE